MIQNQFTKIMCFYTLTMNYWREIKKTILLTVASERIKYLQINLTKEVKH